jgi:hypothetical protein
MVEVTYTVSLRISHPKLPHEEIIAALGMEAKFSHTAGQPRMNPKGAPLEGVYKSTYGCFDLLPKQAGDFADGIRQLLPNLKIHHEFFKKITDEGGRAELFVGVFTEKTTGFILQPAEMAALAELSLELAIEIYY